MNKSIKQNACKKCSAMENFVYIDKKYFYWCPHYATAIKEHLLTSSIFSISISLVIFLQLQKAKRCYFCYTYNKLLQTDVQLSC